MKPASAKPRPLASEDDLAEWLGVHVQTVRRMRRAGKAPEHTTVAGRIRYSWRAIDAWAKARTHQVTIR